MQLLEIKVRDNWQAITHDSFAENAWLWRAVQITVVLSTLLVLLLMAFGAPTSISAIFRRLMLPTLLASIAFWGVIQTPAARHLVVRGTIIVFIVGTIAYLAVPSLQAEITRNAIYYWSTPISIVIAGMGLGSLFLVSQMFPNATYRLGLHRNQSGMYALVGTAIGLALGFHLLLVISYVPDRTYVRLTLPILTWTFFYHAGLRSLSEELFFRGLAFHLLYHGMQKNIVETSIRIAVLNLLMYLVPASLTTNTAVGFWVIVYGTVLALVTTYLRFRQRSLIPALCCNVIFSMFLSTVIG